MGYATVGTTWYTPPRCESSSLSPCSSTAACKFGPTAFQSLWSFFSPLKMGDLPRYIFPNRKKFRAGIRVEGKLIMGSSRTTIAGAQKDSDDLLGIRGMLGWRFFLKKSKKVGSLGSNDVSVTAPVPDAEVLLLVTSTRRGCRPVRLLLLFSPPPGLVLHPSSQSPLERTEILNSDDF